MTDQGVSFQPQPEGQLSGAVDTLFDGSVTVEGADATFATGRTLPDVFKGLIDRTSDMSEFGMTFFLRSLENGAPFIAIPAFPNRIFRHSCIFVNRDSHISSPQDLVGKTIGEFGVYGQDSGVWAKGVLMDEYGFGPSRTAG